MPSVGSISAILNRSHHHEEELSQIVASFPLIDPLDAFYLLNPSGDLSSTQLEFETWFRDQNLEVIPHLCFKILKILTLVFLLHI